MRLDLTTRTIPGAKRGTHPAEPVTVLELSGSITLGGGSLELRQQIRDLLEAGSKKLVLNLAGVLQMDSSGIAELVSALLAVRQKGGSLMLMMPSERVEYLLKITKLNTAFEIHANEYAALNSLEK